jgi:carbamoyl-phosphate synthase large subunit
MTKARMGFAGRGIHRCANPDELRFFLNYSPLDSVIQACLEDATEFSIDCLADLSGKALGAVPRAMLQSKGGEQIKGETLADPQLVELGARVVEALGLVGPCTVQCFRTGDEILGVTDINTRFGGAFPLPQAAGAGYPQKILAMAAGESLAPALGEHRPGVVMTRFLEQTLLERGTGGFAALRDGS